VIRGIGAACILLSGVLIGYRYVWIMNRQLEAILVLEKILSFFLSAVGLRNFTFPQCIHGLKQHLGKELQERLTLVQKPGNEMPVQEDFCKTIEQYGIENNLSFEIMEFFTAPFRQEKQERNKKLFLQGLEAAKGNLTKEYERILQKKKEQARISISLGTMGGIFVLIILI